MTPTQPDVFVALRHRLSKLVGQSRERCLSALDVSALIEGQALVERLDDAARQLAVFAAALGESQPGLTPELIERVREQLGRAAAPLELAAVAAVATIELLAPLSAAAPMGPRTTELVLEADAGFRRGERAGPKS